MNLIAALMFLFSSLVNLTLASVSPSDDAIDFSLKNEKGKLVKLSDYKGKVVVLEWLNHGCPFVKKHYGAKNMQKLQSKYTKKGIVWLSIISSAPGNQGYVDTDGASRDKKEKGSNATNILLDSKGEVGKKYGAKTTPHMYVIDKNFKIAYVGAIDSVPSADPADIGEADNYVSMALESILKGEKVKVAKTKPYGCSVKY